ncbi:MAG: BamA/TamA family outer membrane protein [Candidatus Eisenbacteria bacterium]|nr:BamA/TamA family outer membrane protein [Candidatus Latescibacterota bacterium]MBD3303484.1 BamA/TamA family outer membrane protein [Candidatus Eisenbacteria bacterium]
MARRRKKDRSGAASRAPWILLALLLVPTLAPGAGEPGVPSIEGIEFTGNETIEEDALRGAMRLRQPVWWNPFRRTPYLGADYLAQDLYRVLDVYRDAGFPLATVTDAEVRYHEGEREVTIRITVREGPRCRVDEVLLTGIEGRLRPRALSSLEVERGEWLRRSDLEATRDAVESLLADNGYLGARVDTDVRLLGTSASVVVRVSAGPRFRLREVIVDSGAGTEAKTDPKVVRREVTIEPGEVVRSNRLLRTQDHLFELGIFRTVRVIPEPDSLGRALADLRLVVHERSSGWYGFGAGYSSDDRVRLLAEWGNRNVSGLARRLTVDGDVSFSLRESPVRARSPIRTSLIRARYRSPWFLGTRTRSLTSLYHTYDREARSDDRETVFDLDVTGLEEQLSRSVGRYTRIAVGVSNKWVRTGDPNAADDTYQTRNVSALIEKDRRDSFLDPSRGSLNQFLAEYAGGLLGGQNEFSRWTASTSRYRSLLGPLLVATRLRLGLIVPVGRGVSQGDVDLLVSRIPFEERFRLGGGTTVRGYADNSLGRLDPVDRVNLGGTALLLMNVELRFPIVWLLKGALFLDGGNVWSDVEEIKLDRFRDGFDPDRRSPLDVAYSVGGGLRFVTPVGPFRIDYGRKLGGGQREGESETEFHLSLGQAF